KRWGALDGRDLGQRDRVDTRDLHTAGGSDQFRAVGRKCDAADPPADDVGGSIAVARERITQDPMVRLVDKEQRLPLGVVDQIEWRPSGCRSWNGMQGETRWIDDDQLQRRATRNRCGAGAYRDRIEPGAEWRIGRPDFRIADDSRR